MTKIKIAFIISNLGQGGAERQFYELIKNINKSKFDVTVLIYAYNSSFFYVDIDDINDIIVVKHHLKSNRASLKIFEALLVIYKFLRQSNFDLAFTTMFMNGLFVRLAAPKNYRNKIISTIRNSLKIYTWKHLLVERFYLKKSFVVANTKIVCNEFSNLINPIYRFRVNCIYNGFDTNRFTFKREQFADTIVIGNVGRMVYQKNQLQLLRAFTKLEEKNLKLKIIGSEGDQLKTLVDYMNLNQVMNQVEILDKKADIEDYYHGFDIFVLSSHYEGCPNVLFEAMLSGCLCIISTNANSDQFVINGHNGLVYDGSDHDLLEKLKSALTIIRNNKAKKMISTSYQYAVNNFSISSMVTQYEQLFLRIYEENKSRR